MASNSTQSKRRISPVILLALLALLVMAGIFVDQKTRPRLIAGPMVQIPAADSLAVVWEAKSFFSGGAIRVEGADGRSVTARATESGLRYQATCGKLFPGQRYKYTVLNSGFLGRDVVVAGPFETATPAPRGRPFRFLAFGDSGTGDNSQAGLAEVMARAKPDLIIHTGDLVYPTGNPVDYQRNFFEPYAAMLPTVPFMPVLGNHDCVTGRGQPMLDTFVLPRNSPDDCEPAWMSHSSETAGRFFSFDYGDARFVGLDGNKAGKGDQASVLTPEQMKTIVAPWLREFLSQGDARWKFVYLHQPFYTGSQHSPEGAAYLKDAYVKVFEECGVDMVFCGHNHLYERTAPIRDDQVVPDAQGVVYITTGAGGGARYEEIQPPPPYMRAYRDDVFSFTQVDLNADRLVLKQIGEDGQAFDEYVLVKGAATSAPTSQP